MATQNLAHAAQSIARINPALKGYTLNKPHPLSGHLAADPELLAATGKEEVGKVKQLLQAISRLATDPEVKGLSGLALELLDHLHNTFDCEHECRRDARLAAHAPVDLVLVR